MKNTTSILTVCAALCIAGSAFAAPHVVLPDGRRVEGSAIRALANGDINLTTPSGIRTFARGSYARAVAEKPAEF